MGRTQGPVSLDSPPGAATSSYLADRRLPCPLRHPCPSTTCPQRIGGDGTCIADILTTTQGEVKSGSTTNSGGPPARSRGPQHTRGYVVAQPVKPGDAV